MLFGGGMRGRHGRDRMVVIFITKYAIKFVSELPQVGGFRRVSTNKTDRHDIAEILLKVALNTIKQTSKPIYFECILCICHWYMTYIIMLPVFIYMIYRVCLLYSFVFIE
jgi:hypothetical protein